MLGWAVSRDEATRRHEAARGLRELLGAPEPPEALEIELAPPEGRRWTDLGWSQIPELDPGAGPLPPPPPPPPDLDGVSFVLMLGADNRNDRYTGRTDAMILAAFRHEDGAVAAFSIPRDLWVALPDVGELHAEGRTHARINAVIRVGEIRLGKGEGLPLLRRTLAENLGIRIDRYVRVDRQGFEAMIDALGGVEVDVQCPIQDCFWLERGDAACTMMDIPAGRVSMTGSTALQFVRSRHGRGDRDRTRRQQAVMLALARKARSSGLRGLGRLWRTVEPHLDTDLGPNDAAYYASFALETELSEVRGFSIRHPMTSKLVTEDGKHVLELDRLAFDDALRGLFDQGPLPALTERKTCPAPDAALTYREKGRGGEPRPSYSGGSTPATVAELTRELRW